MKKVFFKLLEVIPGSANITLRALSIAGKFLFVMYLSRYLTTDELGLYSIFATTVMIGSYVLGVEFHVFSNREIMASAGDKQVTSSYIQDQFLLYIFTYLILLPTIIVIVFFFFEILPWDLLWSFVVVLVTFHIVQELQRLLISTYHPVTAIFLVTLHNGIWVYPAIVFGLLSLNARTINFALSTWSVFGIISCVLGLMVIHFRNVVVFSFRRPNWNWIMKGLSTSLIFLCYTVIDLLAMRIDYYILLFTRSRSEVGILSFFSNFATIFVDFITIGVSLYFVPRLVKTYHQGKADDFLRVSREFFRHTLKGTLILLPGFVLGMPIIIYVTGNKELSSNIVVYYILLFASFIMCVSMSFHYIIYAQRKDITLLIITFIGLVVKTALCLVLVPGLGVLGASLATLILCIFLSFTKYLLVTSKLLREIDNNR